MHEAINETRNEAINETAPPAATESAKRYQCRHIFTDGHRCGSPCLRREEFCYYHHSTRRPAQNQDAAAAHERRSRRAAFALPMPEDRSAIQLSIGEVLRRIAANEIDPKRAGLLLYGLQIASLNLPRTAEARRDEAQVEEVIADPQHGAIAPKSEVAAPTKPKSVIGELLDYLDEEQAKEAAAKATAITIEPEPEAAEPEPTAAEPEPEAVEPEPTAEAEAPITPIPAHEAAIETPSTLPQLQACHPTKSTPAPNRSLCSPRQRSGRRKRHNQAQRQGTGANVAPAK